MNIKRFAFRAPFVVLFYGLVCAGIHSIRHEDLSFGTNVVFVAICAVVAIVMSAQVERDAIAIANEKQDRAFARQLAEADASRPIEKMVLDDELGGFRDVRRPFRQPPQPQLLDPTLGKTYRR